MKLLNQELTYTVGTSQIGCGYNGGLYFVDMSGVANQAPTGGGYCDSSGAFPTRCAELDVWEANSVASAFSIHNPNDGSGCVSFVNPNNTGPFNYGYGLNINTQNPVDVVTV